MSQTNTDHEAGSQRTRLEQWALGVTIFSVMLCGVVLLATVVGAFVYLWKAEGHSVAGYLFLALAALPVGACSLAACVLCDRALQQRDIPANRLCAAWAFWSPLGVALVWFLIPLGMQLLGWLD